MAGINITYDGSDLLRFADDMARSGDELPDAVARALNCTGDMVATQMGRTLSDETGLGVRDVRSDFEIIHASPDDLEYTITVPSRVTTLADFDPRQTRVCRRDRGGSGACFPARSRQGTRSFTGSAANAIRSRRSMARTSRSRRDAEQPRM